MINPVFKERGSIFDKPIREYLTIKECTSFWNWLWCDWNFIGGIPPRRIIGRRRFGHSKERQYPLSPGSIVM